MAHRSILQRFYQLPVTRRHICSITATHTQSKVSSKRSEQQIPEDAGCPLCRNGLDRFGYRDVLLLRQFLTPEGYLMGRRITGICPKMQRRIAKAIRRSRQMGLLPNFKASSPTEEKNAEVS